jgi:hypothetical protein
MPFGCKEIECNCESASRLRRVSSSLQISCRTPVVSNTLWRCASMITAVYQCRSQQTCYKPTSARMVHASGSGNFELGVTLLLRHCIGVFGIVNLSLG